MGKSLMLFPVLILSSTGAHASSQEQQDPQPLSERERAIHALNRLAYGAKPGDIDRLVTIGVETWIEQQLLPDQIPNQRCEGLLSELPSVGMSMAEIQRDYAYDIPRNATAEERRAANQLRNEPRSELMKAVLFRAATSERQLEEVLCNFWRNHFNVSFTKGSQITLLITAYENNVIRNNVLGNFESMLTWSAKHPAMLLFLDNALSRRPPTKSELKKIQRNAKKRTGSNQQASQAVQLAEQRGLNENYARELLELHTLGVDNYYKQKDVVAVAEALTGWTISSGKKGKYDGFQFRNEMHVPGNKKVLGRVIRTDNGNGVVEGDQILKLLAHHKGTAKFISFRLCQYLVHDEPSENLVEDIAKVFQKEDGDLREVTRAILRHDEFWSRENYQSKFKTPFEYVMSALRVTGANVSKVDYLIGTLRDMGQPVYLCDPPTGYYDTAEAWLDPGVLATRWEFAIAMARNRIKGITIPDSFYEDIPLEPARLWQHHLTMKVIPGGVGQRTQDALTEITDHYLRRNKVPEIKELGPELLGLLLGCPEFQSQ